MFGLAVMACVAVTGVAQETFRAYEVPENTPGTQNYNGSLGMHFDVDNAIIVTRLGVFDEASDGLKLPLIAKIYDRDTQTELVVLEFSPEAPGELVGGSRFKALETPLRLEAGFKGTMAAEGYGAEERLNNSGGVAANVRWTVNTGNGSIRFVGTSSYGAAGSYPGTADGGPAARYAAGTFEFRTTPPLKPGLPVVTAKAGDKHVMLAWQAVTAPLPAAKYQIWRSSTLDGTYTQVGETTETTYSDENLVNGNQVCYRVRAVSADNKSSDDSAAKCATPYALAANHFVAYFVPGATAGNQAYGGSLGMDFDVENPIIVKRLGVFDDNSDGLKLAISARIYNRETMEVIAEVAFSPEDQGDAIEGMRFKALESPLRIEAGFKGSMVADGYGAEERNGNSGSGGWTVQDGNGSIVFTGRSRYGTGGEFPGSLDGGPAARYAAGTFEYEITAPQRPSTPQAAAQAPAEDAAVTLTWAVVLTPLPAAKYIISRAASSEGPFTKVGETTETTYRDAGLVNGTTYCYVVRAEGSGGQASPDSAPVCSTPNPRRGGTAYIIPEGLVGNQAYGGSLGMDFNVAKPIKITRFGVFDDSQDGLMVPITAMLYNRETRTPLTTLEFTPEEPGELILGSRFKTLTTPITLAAGFQGTMVAYGYAADERNYNQGSAPGEGMMTFDGGSLVFIGGSRYGEAGQFPVNPDGGPVNRYGAGTFVFEPEADVQPARLTAAWSAGKIKITWTGAGALERASSVTGPWAAVAGAASGIEVAVEGSNAFFRLKQ